MKGIVSIMCDNSGRLVLHTHTHTHTHTLSSTQNVQTRLKQCENEAGEKNLNMAVDAKNTGVQRKTAEFPTVAANSRWLCLPLISTL